MLSYAGAAGPLLASLTWMIALMVDPGPWAGGSAAMISLGTVGLATVACVGLVVHGARWAHRSGMIVIGLTMLVGLTREVDLVWLVALSASAVALVLLFSPSLLNRARKLPSATGPSDESVVLSLVLVGLPFVFGWPIVPSAWPAVVLGATAPLAAFLYSRVIPGGLVAVRMIWPALAVALSPFLGWPDLLIGLGAAVSILFLAWRPPVKTAYHPPHRQGTGYPIPPELTPKEILDAAGLDEKGHRT